MTDNDRATRRIRTGPPAPAGPPQLLGTPLSPSATKVMLLGSGELGKEVIIAFQRLGVEVVAVDRYADAPGHQVAHHSEVIDMTDPVQVREVIERHRPQFVVPEIEAIATEALAEVERDGLAEVIPTAHAVVATMNRESIRRLADEKLGLPTSPYRFADSEDELATAAGKIGFPCVVKPVMSSSGHGQSVLHSPNDVAEAWRIATTGGRVATTRVIVEGFIEFDYEITLLTVRSVDPSTGRLTIQFCEPIGHRQIAGDYVESWQPQEMNADAFDSARSVAARIVTAMGQGDFGGRGVFGVELFVKGADVYFSEVSPRPHDTGLVTMATQRLSEFEMHARAILGLPVDITLASPGASAVIYGRHEAKAISFANVAAALQVPETDIRLFGKPEAHPRRRMGVVTATADTVDEARRRATAAASRVQPVVPNPAPVAGEAAPRNPAPQNPESQNPAPQATAVHSRPQPAADLGPTSGPAPAAQPDPGVHTEVVRRPSGPTAIKPSELDPERSPRS